MSSRSPEVPAIPSDSAARLPRRWHRVARWVRRLAWLAALAWALLIAAWLALHFFILPQADRWRPLLEQRASAALGTPVRIGALRARSSGLVPSVELDDVRLLDAQGRDALRLPRVMAALSWRSLAAWQLRFEQLVIDGADLEVRRDADGHLHVAGIDMAAGNDADDAAAADWLLAQREVAVRGGRVRWIDEQRAAPPLELQAVDAVLRNSLGGRHALRVDATPPAAWGDRFSLVGRFRQPLIGRASEWRQWSGTLHIELPRADAAELHRYATLPFALREGSGALRAWLDIERGQWQAATADVALRDVSLKLAPVLEPLAIRELAGRLLASRSERGISFGAERLGFVTGDGERWPAGNLRLTLQRPAAHATPPAVAARAAAVEAVAQPSASGASASASAPVSPAAPLAVDLDWLADAVGGSFSADQLDLGLLARLAASMPLGAPARRMLAELRPQGVAHKLDSGWDGPLDAPTRYSARGRLEALAIDAGRVPPAAPGELMPVGRPGLRNAQLEFDATEAGGRATLRLDGGALVFPGVFERPQIALDHFGAKLAWKIERHGATTAPDIELQVSDARFDNADAAGEFNARWRSGGATADSVTTATTDRPALARLLPAALQRGAAGGAATGAPPVAAASAASAAPAATTAPSRFPGLLDLEGRLSRGQAVAVARYLPLGLPHDARDYVNRAVQGGRITQASFRVHGDLRDFPSYTRGGEFRIEGQVEDVTLAYVPPARPGAAPSWPAFTKLAGGLVFDRIGMQIHKAQARLWGLELSQIDGAIADLDKAELLIGGRVRGPAADLLRFVRESPLDGWSDGRFRHASASGNAELKLALRVPAADPEKTRVDGAVTLAGNDLRLAPQAPLLAATSGRVEFTQDGVNVREARTTVAGGELRFAGGTRADGALRFEGQGTASAQGLRSAAQELGGSGSPIAGVLAGSAPYKLALGFVAGGHVELQLASTLAGMALDLPAPFGKSADASLPLLVEQRVTSAAGAAPRDRLRIELGTLAQAWWERALDGSAAPRVLRGAIGVRQPPPQPGDAGVRAAAQFDKLDLDAWRALAERLQPAGSSGAATAAAATDYLPQQIALQAQQLVVGGRRFSALRLDATRRSSTGGGANWSGNVDAAELAGSFDYAGGGDGRLKARLTRLALGRSGLPEAGGTAPAGAAKAPSLDDLPALDIVVDAFQLAGKELGKLEIQASHPPPPAAGWRLDRLALATPEARLSGQGRWSQAVGAAPRRYALDFVLALADSGALLERLGFGSVLRGGRGRLDGQASWQGSPFDIDMPTLDGKLHLAMSSGQFLTVAPGVGRLLGVLSLQALPRRLTLDFRDLFGTGFAFDNIDGDILIERGQAGTTNLRMRGLQAAVLMEGRANLVAETQDLRVVVVPQLDAGTAALAFGVLNPVIGLGSFLTQLLLKKPLMAAATREFRISGSWDDPKVERVERRIGAALPDFDSMAPTAAGPPRGAASAPASAAPSPLPPNEAAPGPTSGAASLTPPAAR